MLMATAALFSAFSASAGEAESFETVTSVTTYSTSKGVSKRAAPAYILDTTGGYPSDPLATQLYNDMTGVAQTIKTRAGRGLTLVKDVKAETWFAGVKSGGAVAVAVWFAPEVAGYYAITTGVMGAFKPFGKVIDHGLSADLTARVDVLGKDGKVIFTNYRAIASNRSGLGDALHYTVRGISAPSSEWNTLAYIGGEIVSFYAGKLPQAFGFHPVIQEAIGTVYGSAAEEQFLKRTAPGSGSGNGNYTSMTVPDHFGGFRTITIPRADLRPSVSLIAPAPKLDVIVIGPVDVPPFALEQAVSTFRAQGATSVTVQRLTPFSAIVSPRTFEGPPPSVESAPQGTTRLDNDHSIDLPKSIEIHGIGSFKINR